jgi:hypothetical protein
MKTDSFLRMAAIASLSAQVALADGGALHQAKQTPPIKLGTSGGSSADVSRAFCCGGTLGAAVFLDGQLAILGNNHVLARSGSAVTGEDTIQPGLIDVGCRPATANVVGDFAGNIVRLGSANVDTALSYARSGMVDATGAILDVGVPCTIVQPPFVGLAVKKSGRTTGLTKGTITSVNTSVSIQYQTGCNAGKKFVIAYQNQLVTGAMSAGGDSGSLLVTDEVIAPKPVGLLFAGSSSTTIYNPIQDVVNAYVAAGHTFSFVGTTCGAPLAPQGGAAALSLSPEKFNRAHQAKVENEHDLMGRPGVWGVGVGASEEDPAEAVIVIYLESPGRVVPPSIPKELDGTKVRVVFTDPIVAQ